MAGLREPYGVPGKETGSVKYKASNLPAVISPWSFTLYLSGFFYFQNSTGVTSSHKKL